MGHLGPLNVINYYYVPFLGPGSSCHCEQSLTLNFFHTVIGVLSSFNIHTYAGVLECITMILCKLVYSVFLIIMPTDHPTAETAATQGVTT